jgi:ribosomal protein L11 methyltransferase
VIDPGHAFGTGAHPTTRMCLELLCELADAGAASGQLADLGTGSGVLAIAAAKLGWAPVIACDHELAALDAARANAAANATELALLRLNLRAEPPPAAATVVANLTAPLLTELAPRLAERREAGEPRAVVCSGMLASELGTVTGRLVAAGLIAAEHRAEGDWAALLLLRE